MLHKSVLLWDDLDVRAKIAFTGKQHCFSMLMSHVPVNEIKQDLFRNVSLLIWLFFS